MPQYPTAGDACAGVECAECEGWIGQCVKAVHEVRTQHVSADNAESPAMSRLYARTFVHMAGSIKMPLGMEVGLGDTVSMRERWSCEHTLSILSINRLTLRQQQPQQPQQPRPLMDSAHDILHPPPSRKPLWTDNPVISVIMYTVARRQFSAEPFRYSTTIS